MSIQSITSEVNALTDSYLADSRAIEQNKMLSQDGRNAQFLPVQANAVRALLAKLVSAFGDTQQANERIFGVYTFSPDAPVWSEQRSLEQAVYNAKQTAERAGVDPAWALYGLRRAESIVAEAGVLDGSLVPNLVHYIIEQYNSADQQVRIAFQDFRGTLIPQNGQEAAVFLGQLGADRQARVTTPQVRAAETAYDAFRMSIGPLWEAFQRAVNVIASGNFTPGLQGEVQAIMRIWGTLQRAHTFEPKYGHTLDLNRILGTLQIG